MSIDISCVSKYIFIGESRNWILDLVNNLLRSDYNIQRFKYLDCQNCATKLGYDLHAIVTHKSSYFPAYIWPISRLCQGHRAFTAA
jgi:hypothetical protein